MSRRKERAAEKEAAINGEIAEALGMDCPFPGEDGGFLPYGMRKIPHREARQIVLSSAVQSVRKFLGDYGAEDADADVTLADIFEKAKRDDSKTWLIEDHRLNRTQVMNLLVHQVAEGELLPALCRVPGMPNLLTVERWREDFTDFAAWMSRAERAAAALWMAETLEIADGTKPSESFVAKLQMDQRSKMAALFDSKRWNPKQSVDVTIHESVDEHHVKARLESMLLSNMGRYREMFGILMVREEDFAALVLKEAQFLLDRGVEVLKTKDFKELTFDAEMFRVNERVERP